MGRRRHVIQTVRSQPNTQHLVSEPTIYPDLDALLDFIITSGHYHLGGGLFTFCHDLRSTQGSPVAVRGSLSGAQGSMRYPSRDYPFKELGEEKHAVARTYTWESHVLTKTRVQKLEYTASKVSDHSFS